MSHIEQMKRRYVQEHGKAPAYLAIGFWDMRELLKFAAPFCRPLTTPLGLLRAAKGGPAYLWDIEVKVDFRVGRMPGALWFPLPRILH